MRAAKFWIPLAILLALTFGAQAGGKGAVRAVMYEASTYTVWINYPETPPMYVQRTFGDGERVGFVILTPTHEQTLKVAIRVHDGPPNEDLGLIVYPADFDLGGATTVTTDAKGRGSLDLELAIPERFVAAGSFQIKVVLNGADEMYATDSRKPPFVNPPDDPNPTPTSHVVRVK